MSDNGYLIDSSEDEMAASYNEGEQRDDVMSKEEAVRKHLELLPEPERTLALKRVNPWHIKTITELDPCDSVELDPYDPRDALYVAFDWDRTLEGAAYWDDLNERYQEILKNREREEQVTNEETISKEQAVRRHLAILPEPERSLALKRVDPAYIEVRTVFDPYDRLYALYTAFNWTESPEGYDYWSDLNNRYFEPLRDVEDCKEEEESMDNELSEEQEEGESSYYSRTTTQTILPRGEPLFSERATKVSIVDEAAGEFLIIEQERGAIRIDPEEWTAIRDVISRMVGEIWDHQQKGESC